MGGEVWVVDGRLERLGEFVLVYGSGVGVLGDEGVIDILNNAKLLPY